jgi:hypothetical protein
MKDLQKEILRHLDKNSALIKKADTNSWYEVEGCLRKAHEYLTSAVIKLDALIRKEEEQPKLIRRLL